MKPLLGPPIEGEAQPRIQINWGSEPKSPQWLSYDHHSFFSNSFNGYKLSIHFCTYSPQSKWCIKS